MDRSKPQKSIISTGITSFVLIFVMLSLLTFSVLSLVSAQANLRLSRKSADRTSAYYAAENEANEVLMGLVKAAGESPKALEAYAAGADVTLTDGARAAYQVPLGEDQVLAVELTLPAGEAPCRIDRWQAVSRYDWAPDDSLNLLSTGGLPPILNEPEE